MFQLYNTIKNIKENITKHLPVCGIIIVKMNYYERAKYFRTKKRLGQNFLINGEVIHNILDYADIQPEDTVVEIGPGVGFVTEQLIKKQKRLSQLSLMKKLLKNYKSLMHQI